MPAALDGSLLADGPALFVRDADRQWTAERGGLGLWGLAPVHEAIHHAPQRDDFAVPDTHLKVSRYEHRLAEVGMQSLDAEELLLSELGLLFLLRAKPCQASSGSAVPPVRHGRPAERREALGRCVLSPSTVPQGYLGMPSFEALAARPGATNAQPLRAVA